MVRKVEQVLKFASVYKAAQEYDENDELYRLKEKLIEELLNLKYVWDDAKKFSHQLMELISKYERESTKENKSYIIERADLLFTKIKDTNISVKPDIDKIDELISLLVKF
jgi:hypothetical protein